MNLIHPKQNTPVPGVNPREGKVPTRRRSYTIHFKVKVVRDLATAVMSRCG